MPIRFGWLLLTSAKSAPRFEVKGHYVLPRGVISYEVGRGNGTADLDSSFPRESGSLKLNVP